MCILIVFAFALVFSASVSNAEEEGKIVGGYDTQIEKYPYQLSFREFGSHICGAALIRPNFALTAAHCTDGIFLPFIYSVTAGSTSRTEGGTTIAIFRIYQNPQYDSDSVNNDISVLELMSSFTYSSSIQAIPLSTDPIPDGTMATATGWGTLTSGATTLPVILQEVQIPIVSDETCKSEYGDADITPNMLCAGYVQGGKDTCQGDSGGPLNCNGFLCGLTSWGAGCAEPGFVGVYTKVSQYTGYIKGITG